MRGWRCRKRWILRPRGKPSSWWSFPASSRRRMRSGCCERNCLDLSQERKWRNGTRREEKKGLGLGLGFWRRGEARVLDEMDLERKRRQAMENDLMAVIGFFDQVLLGSDSSEKLHGDSKISDLPDSNQRPKDGN
ncbi:hypothetical protein OIU84_013186 [Salix udensis]|uniref:Uncharacterized protein n=1 Tax=Salix udensis TaxID=889485 RepID=A0AAD6NTQ2_9ROSI|nr:hypothetical protein OIU84_013186 [Salix udensis]